jgi:oligopeptide/dipeptide ABC transporter ATP-binding protein
MVPDLLDLPPGCKFQARCPKVFEACRGGEPQLKTIGSPEHLARCYLY